VKSLRRFFLRLASFTTRRAQDERLREEIEQHIALQTAENIRAGLSPVEARRQALLKFGGVEAIKQDYRARRGLPFVENVVQDVRFALRLLRKSPGFTAIAVATLALGIGANAVVFAAMNALILRPLNVPQAQSLYGLQRESDHFPAQSYPDYIDLRDSNRSFDGLAAYNIGMAGLDTGENTFPAWLYEVSGNYFDVLGIQPYLGRFFHGADEHGPNSAPYIVLTYAYWHNRFQDDRTVVGRTVQLNKHPFTIIGVAPPEFHGTLLFLYPDSFVPMVNQEQIDGASFLNARGNRWVFMTLGHLKQGVSPAQAVADLNSIGSYLEKTYPGDDAQMTFVLARPGLYGDYLGRPAQAFLTALMMLAGLILLAACANLASLFAARAVDRSREVALRLALGSSRLRILRQLFTETILISLIGGALGLWGSVLLLQWLRAWQPFPQFPINLPVSPDANVYAVALLLALASGFLFGAVPVRQMLHTHPYSVIKSGSTGKIGRRITVRDILIALQITICAVLVTSSLVAVRGLARSLHDNVGFVPQNSLLVQTDLHIAGYRSEDVPRMQKRMIEAMQSIPGVTSVGFSSQPPLSNGRPSDSIVFTDSATDLHPANAATDAMLFSVSPEYFHADGTALLAGRDFTWQDDENAPLVAVINQEFARRVFGSATSALGRYYKMPDGTRRRVVGVVEEGKYTSLTETPMTAMFLPVLQSPSTQTALVLRSNALNSTEGTQQLAAAVRSKLRGLDAGLSALIQTRSEAMDFVLFPSRVATMSLGLLGVMGAMLSITGIFGMAAYSVSRRKRELGIRIALGAQRKEVLQAALGRAFKLLAFGSATGLLLGILASRVLASIVYQATPRDPLVLAGVVLAMAFLGLLATWIPAQRALSIDPLILMREE
jgi:predicted permease